MKKQLITFVVLISFASCGTTEKDIPNGGSCSYKTVNYPAEVIEIFGDDSTHYTAYFVVTQHEVTDTISKTIDPAQMDTLNIKKGDKFTWEVKDITNGHCSPHIEWLRLERFKQ